MSKLTLITLAVFAVAISVRCFAEPLEGPDSHLNRKEEQDNLAPDAEDIDRSASAQAYASVSNRLRPGAYQPPNQVRLVECYACTDCPKVLQNSTTKYCPYTSDYTKNNKCVVYAEKYRQMEKPWFVRGCATERGSCAEITRGHEHNEKLVRLLSCFECDGDKCNTNGVYRSLPDFTTALLVVVISPLLGKYALS